MENKKTDNGLDELIRASVVIADVPPKDLNDKLKRNLYRQEAEMRRTLPVRKVFLWYLPMILNIATFSLLAVLAVQTITNPVFSAFAAGVCGYICIAGIVITIVGVKRTNMKQDITIQLGKREAAV